MDSWTCILINTPLVSVSLTAYTFFFYCLISNHRSQVGIKQPLKLLLYAVVCSSTLYLLALVVLFFFYTHGASDQLSLSLNILLYISLTTSLTSAVWQNFFYRFQIVPARQKLSMWIKRNIKSIIYSLIFVDRLFCTLEAVASFVYSIRDLQRNRTADFEQEEPVTHVLWFVVWTLRGYYCVCLLIIVLSCWSTALYLCMHLRRMAAHKALSSPRFWGQVRTSVTGMLQGVIYVVYASWLTFLYLTGRSFSNIFIPYNDITFINVYIICSVFCLAVGQNVFRQKMADIWVRVTKPCGQRV